MSLTIPGHVQQAQAARPTLRYPWDDWNAEAAEGPVDPSLLATLPMISVRGNLALLAASAEWLLHRLLPFADDDPLPLEAAEALWAQVVDWRYAAAWNPFDEDEWTGAVRGPIRRMAMWMREGPQCASDGLSDGVRRCAAAATMLAAHVQPRPDAMRAWLSFALARLLALSPARENDPLGEVVPREALDSTLAFVVEDTEGLIDRFLRGLDYSQGPTGNGFLMLPTEMAAEGFTGTPYRFDIAQDRHQRGV